MVKTRRNITFSEKNEKVLKILKKDHFCLSEWVNKQFMEEFSSIEQKKDLITKYETNIVILTKQIKEMQERQIAYTTNYSRPEIRFLTDINRLVMEGKDMKSLLNRFNISFHKELTMQQFKKVIAYYTLKQKRK